MHIYIHMCVYIYIYIYVYVFELARLFRNVRPGRHPPNLLIQRPVFHDSQYGRRQCQDRPNRDPQAEFRGRAFLLLSFFRGKAKPQAAQASEGESRHSRQSVERVSGTSLGSNESHPSREFTKGGLVKGGLAIVA